MSESKLPEATDDTGSDYWIGFDLGGTKMLSTICDSSFTVVHSKRKSTKAGDGADVVLSRLKQLIHRTLSSADLTLDQIVGIGIGIPGPINMADGIVLETPNIGFSNLPLREILEREFKRPVYVANDVDAGVYGEYRLGAAQNARCVMGLYPGTGVGGGCVLNGEILTGRNSTAFEIGHMGVQPSGPLCGCGRRGCLEAVASRLAISSAAAAAAARGAAPYLKENAGTDLTNIRSGALAASIRNGDAAVEMIVRDAARRLGMAAGWMVNLIGPDVIVLGGGLVEALPDLYLEEVRKAAGDEVLPSLRTSYDVRIADLGDFSVAQGVAAWAHSRHSLLEEDSGSDGRAVLRRA